MATQLFWVDGPWSGRLALSARPRGDDWLQGEIQSWRDAGIGVVLSLLTSEEERELQLTNESGEARAAGIDFLQLPIPDLQVPSSPSEVTAILEQLDMRLTSGRNAVIHCRQGVGRTGMVAACLLVMKGADPEAAVKWLQKIRGTAIPETPEQRRWIDLYASSLSHAK